MKGITRSALFVSALVYSSFGAPGCAMESGSGPAGPDARTRAWVRVRDHGAPGRAGVRGVRALPLQHRAMRRRPFCTRLRPVLTPRAPRGRVGLRLRANIACDESSPKCAPPASDWGHQFCIALNGQCDYAGLGCTEEDASLLDEAAAWLKDDVREQAMKCIQEDSCSDVEACVDAWFQAVFP